MYGQLSPSFAVSGGVQQEYPSSLVLVNLMGDLLRRVLDNVANCDVEFSRGPRVDDLVYSSDGTLLEDGPQVVQDPFEPPDCRSHRVGHALCSFQVQSAFPRLAERPSCAQSLWRTSGNSQKLCMPGKLHLCW